MARQTRLIVAEAPRLDELEAHHKTGEESILTLVDQTEVVIKTDQTLEDGFVIDNQPSQKRALLVGIIRPRFGPSEWRKFDGYISCSGGGALDADEIPARAR